MSAEDRDTAILALARADPEGALGLLYSTYSGLVRNYLIRMVGNEAAEDVTHEVFLRAGTYLERFRGESSLGWWLTRVAASCGARHLARRRESPSDTALDGALAPGNGPEEVALVAADRSQARQALERLEPADREILLLREVMGLSYEQIQSRMQVRFLGTVRSRLHKARDALRRAWFALAHTRSQV